MYAGQKTEGKSPFTLEKELSNQDYPAARDQPDNEAERSQSLGAGQLRQFHFITTHSP